MGFLGLMNPKAVHQQKQMYIFVRLSFARKHRLEHLIRIILLKCIYECVYRATGTVLFTSLGRWLKYTHYPLHLVGRVCTPCGMKQGPGRWQTSENDKYCTISHE